MPRIFMVVTVLFFCAAAGAAEPCSFVWWADGWQARSPEGRQMLHFQGDCYGAAVDVEKPAVTRLGPLDSPKAYAAAVMGGNEALASLPDGALSLELSIDGVLHTCTGSASKQGDSPNFPVRLIESGRWLQRVDILNLTFANGQGKVLDAEARLELVAWPDSFSVVLEVAPGNALKAVDLRVGLKGKTVPRHYDTLAAGEKGVAGITWRPGEEKPADEMDPPPRVTDPLAENKALPVDHDPLRNWHLVNLPERQWQVAGEPDRLDRFGILLENPGNTEKTWNLLFAFDEPFPGVTGLCPMLRDDQGNPAGIPVQISKNWHRLEDRRFLYEGPWFHGFTRVTVPPGQTWKGELAITYARWGGVPSASHAQLCLIGWGVNQRWDQAAIGSWGESICYDPDVNLNRSMIDDVRPLMVTGMQGDQWAWTVNVGGGDFLVCYDQNGKKQRLVRMRAAYLEPGPNLTRTVYGGITADGAVSARLEVSTPRCDDVNRAFHRIRYDVLAPVNFSRLAFYQLGADHYNDHQFSTMARGNREGLVEEWTPEKGGRKYHRTGMPCGGELPWFSLHGGIADKHHPKAAWANRGLVVRSWKARLGGKDAPAPFASVYGTEDGIPSANLELAPPPGIDRLEPGDFVEAELELLILPQSADDYYGPNGALRADLAANGNTWKPVWRLAKGNDLEVRAATGTVTRRYPVEVAAGEGDRAVFDVTGGMGYVPVTLTGFKEPKGYVLECDGVAVDQSVHGNDFWQSSRDGESGAWTFTYNVPLDSPGDGAKTRHFVFRRADDPTREAAK